MSVMGKARAVPRSARVAQGFPRISDFVDHMVSVRNVREQRCREVHEKIARVSRRKHLLSDFDLVLQTDKNLKRLARQEAGCANTDSVPLKVEWRPGHGEPKEFGERARSWKAGPRYRYSPSTRIVIVPASWVLRKIREGECRFGRTLREAAAKVCLRKISNG